MEKRLSVPKIIAVFLFFTVISQVDLSSQQLSNSVDLSFGIQKWDPVHIKVDERNTGSRSEPIKFTASNSTYYPFMLLIDFVQFNNLSPRPPVREIRLGHGINNLFSISPQVPGQSYGYEYTYKYRLASSETDDGEYYPYLIPLKVGTIPVAKKTTAGMIPDSFTGSKGDTIYCMRRGLVTAVPRSETKDFRISGYDCLEVLHENGTYMIYQNLNRKDAFSAPGKVILPGQALGTLSDSCYLIVKLMQIEKNNLMLDLQIRYSTGQPDPVPFSEIENKCKSVWPGDVMVRELKKKEIKQIR